MVNSGLYEYISQDEIIASAKMQLACEVSDNDIWFTRLCNEAIRHFDSLSVFIKRQCNIAINDLKADLPNGFYKILALRVNGSPNCFGMMYIDQPFLESCGCNNWNGVGYYNYAGVFQINKGQIIFNSTINTCDEDGNIVEATDCDIAFIGMNVDENGMMCVRRDMERGVVAYICYMYMLQNGDKYSQWQLMEHKSTWTAQKAWIQSVDVQNKFFDTRRQIAAITNNWIQNKSGFI